MWCEKVIRSFDPTSDPDRGGRTVERIEIAWNECTRMLKKQTLSGEPVRVLLPPGQILSHNDVVFESATRAIVIYVIPCEVIMAHVSNAKQMAILALELGNLHCPSEVGTDYIIFIEDGPAMSVSNAMKLRWTKEVRRFTPTPIISVPTVSVGPDFRVIRSRNNDTLSYS